MSLYDTVRHDLRRYNARWYEAMHLSDLACWLANWRGSALLDLYAEALAEKKLARSLSELAVASRLAKAAYVALSPETVKAIATDKKTFDVLLALCLEERKEHRARLLEARKRLLVTLRALLPDRYNRPGG